MTREKLSDGDVKSALQNLNGQNQNAWTLADGKLHRQYKFSDFTHAFAFMTAAALASEKRNHHPEWSNVWNRVTIDLSTHDAGGITMSDVELAKIFEDLAKRFL